MTQTSKSLDCDFLFVSLPSKTALSFVPEGSYEVLVSGPIRQLLFQKHLNQVVGEEVRFKNFVLCILISGNFVGEFGLVSIPLSGLDESQQDVAVTKALPGL